MKITTLTLDSPWYMNCFHYRMQSMQGIVSLEQYLHFTGILQFLLRQKQYAEFTFIAGIHCEN